MTGFRKYIVVFLTVVYAFFFASTNLFYHTHHLVNSVLVHSHPFSGAGHTHTASQLVLIDAVDSSVYQGSVLQTVPEFVPTAFGSELCLNPITPVLSTRALSFSLRAPPASC
ncbi:MAG: hypothetical protein MJY42_03525 [Bacteroidales bacterium]|nr:hypothetical protein [Bacteroidales bacterium]